MDRPENTSVVISLFTAWIEHEKLRRNGTVYTLQQKKEAHLHKIYTL